MLTTIGVLNVAVYSISVHLHYKEKKSYRKAVESLAASRQVHQMLRHQHARLNEYEKETTNYMYNFYNII